MNKNLWEDKTFHSLFDLIQEYQKRNCDFILTTDEYQDLNQQFKSFFKSNFKYEDIKQIDYNCFIYQNYIIKFNDQKLPPEIINLPFLVHTYYRNNFKFTNCDNVMYLGIEIQDYLQNTTKVNNEDLYSLYKQLRCHGYIWMDANIGNALIYQNKPIVVDKDYIYLEKDANFINQSRLSKAFEERYQEETKK